MKRFAVGRRSEKRFARRFAPMNPQVENKSETSNKETKKKPDRINLILYGTHYIC